MSIFDIGGPGPIYQKQSRFCEGWRHAPRSFKPVIDARRVGSAALPDGLGGERQCGRAGSQSRNAVCRCGHCRVRHALGNRLSARWQASSDREGRQDFHRHPVGRQDRGRRCAAGRFRRSERPSRYRACSRFRKSGAVYFSYNEPAARGSSVVLARAVLDEGDGKAALKQRKTIWKQDVAARGGQPGGIIAFAPDGRHLFFSVGDRMEPASAQDDEAPKGKILRMNLDGSVPVDNPHADEGGIRALTWTTGHRNPYGLAFGPDGKLFEHEMGARRRRIQSRQARSQLRLAARLQWRQL